MKHLLDSVVHRFSFSLQEEEDYGGKKKEQNWLLMLVNAIESRLPEAQAQMHPHLQLHVRLHIPVSRFPFNGLLTFSSLRALSHASSSPPTYQQTQMEERAREREDEMEEGQIYEDAPLSLFLPEARGSI